MGNSSTGTGTTKIVKYKFRYINGYLLKWIGREIYGLIDRKINWYKENDTYIDRRLNGYKENDTYIDR